MFVTGIFLERWEGATSKGEDIQNPPFERIQTALRQLDGVVNTMAMLYHSADAFQPCLGIRMSAAGDCYFVVNMRADGINLTLTDPAFAASSDEVVFNIGSQTTTHPARHCVPFVLMIRAASAYAMSGELDAALIWETIEAQ